MTFVEIVLHYQHFDPLTGRFDRGRSRKDYATLLGVPPQAVNRLAWGQSQFNLAVARGLARTFPQAREALATAILTAPDDQPPRERAA